MLINDLAKEIHQNAVDHGWWETKRDFAETAALIHSEWSEALEEARAGRSNVYKLYMGENTDDMRYVALDNKDYAALHTKPEGIAVEIIDGCIRILDYFGSANYEVTEEDGTPSTIESLYNNGRLLPLDYPLPKLIATLHAMTSLSYANENPLTGPDVWHLCEALALGLSWVKRQGIDPLKLLLEKHEYNKTRPYKHGKQF